MGLSLIFSLVIGFVLAALLDQKIRFENTFRTILLYPVRPVLHRHRSRLAVDSQPGFRHSARGARPAGKASPSIRSTMPDIVIYGVLIAGLWQGTGSDHVPDAGRPARH
jgi:glucose/mannose transport system permease protein